MNGYRTIVEPEAPAPPTPNLDSQKALLQRGLGVAILQARSECCAACRVLVGLRELIGKQAATELESDA